MGGMAQGVAAGRVGAKLGGIPPLEFEQAAVRRTRTRGKPSTGCSPRSLKRSYRKRWGWAKSKRWSSDREKMRGQVKSLEERANKPEEVIGGFKNRRRLCAWRRVRRGNIRQLDEAGREFAVERYESKSDANRVAESKEVMCQRGALFL